MMRVLHCIPALGAGGAERQLALLSRILPRLGWEVHVAALSGGNFEDSFDPGTVAHRVPSSWKHDPRVPLRLASLIGRIRPSIVQTWLLKMDVLGGSAALLRGVPWIATERSSALGYPPHWTVRLRNALMAHADALVANSRGGLDLWRNAATPQRRLIIRNGIDLAACDTSAAPEFLDIPAGVSLIVASGRLVEEKRMGVLLDALSRLPGEVRVMAVLCGTGPLEDDLRALVHALDLDDRVMIAGFVKDVGPLVNRADLFVSMSRFEGSPNAVQEAMGFGTPVVLSDIPSHRELADEQGAQFVNGDDAGQLAATILDCIRNRDAARARAAHARELASAWSIDAMGSAYDALYRQVLAARRLPVEAPSSSCVRTS